MKLLTFAVDGQTRYGALADDGVVDLSRPLGARYPDLQAVIEAGALDQAAAIAAEADAEYRLRELVVLPPLARPSKILCVGVNYRTSEYGDGPETPRYPSIFMRTPRSLTGHGQPLIRPPESAELDYEGEIALVVGREGRRIRPQDADGHIAGYTIVNDGTLRDWARHHKRNVTPGKNFDASGAIGPWIATPDEMPPESEIRVTTHVNGEVRQDDTAASMIFSMPEIVAYVSSFTTLLPGDVVATGTPQGAGAWRDPPAYLKPGDMVTVTVSGIGTLENGVVDEVAEAPPRR